MTSWTALFGSDQLDLPQSIALDNNTQQNIFSVGHTTGSIGDNSNQGNNDVFITRYNRDGSVNFIEQFGTGFADLAHEVEIDNNNKLFIIGETEGNLGGENQGNSDPFLTRYDNQGNREFAIQFGTAEQDTGRGLAIDNANNTVFLTGSTFGEIEEGASQQVSSDAWVASHSSVDGTQNWIRQFGSDQDDQALDTAVDSQGNVYVVGWTEGSLAEDTENQGDKDAWLAKYTPDGELDWTSQIASPAEDQATSLAIDNSDNIFLSGFTRGDVTGDGDEFANEGESDIWVAKYNPEGGQEKVIQYGSFGREFAYDVTTDSQGRVYIAGTSDGIIKGLFPGFEPYDASAETFLINVTRLNGDLALSSSQINVSDSTENDVVNAVLGWAPLADQARGVAVDNENDIFFTGETFGPSDFPPGGTGTSNAGRADGFVTRIGDELLAQDDEEEEDPQETINPVVETAQFILINDSPLPEAGDSFTTETIRSFQGSPVSFDVNYDVRNADDETLSGLGLRIHYDSSQLEFDEVDNLFQDGLINASVNPTADEEDFDDDPDTDQFVQFAWADPSNNWPGTSPQNLLTPNFTTTLEFDGTSEINFTSSSTANGLQLNSQPLQVQVGRDSTGEDDPLGEINDRYQFDVDGNGEVDALTDGLQILRNLFGLAPSESAIDTDNGSRTSLEEVADYLDLAPQLFDVDGDGEVSALSDGILISRFAFGITGEELVSGGVLGENATRTSAEDITNYIQNFLPEVAEA